MRIKCTFLFDSFPSWLVISCNDAPFLVLSMRCFSLTKYDNGSQSSFGCLNNLLVNGTCVQFRRTSNWFVSSKLEINSRVHAIKERKKIPAQREERRRNLYLWRPLNSARKKHTTQISLFTNIDYFVLFRRVKYPLPAFEIVKDPTPEQSVGVRSH